MFPSSCTPFVACPQGFVPLRGVAKGCGAFRVISYRQPPRRSAKTSQWLFKRRIAVYKSRRTYSESAIMSMCRLSRLSGRKLDLRALANSNNPRKVHFASRSVLKSCDLLLCDNSNSELPKHLDDGHLQSHCYALQMEI
jgi:hypothetical protein